MKVTLDGGVITISGERKHQKEQKDANEIRIESFYGTFSRSFSLPENIDANGIRAETKDGRCASRFRRPRPRRRRPFRSR